MAEQSLKSKTIKGTMWSAIDSFSRMGIMFIVSIILARLLSPEEYGLIGILTIFISIFNTIVDSGFANAIIRKKDAQSVDFSTAFYTNIALSFAMAATFFACAHPIASFFGRPELVSLTQVMSVIVIINGFCIVQRSIVTRNIDFKTQTKITLASCLTSAVVGISMAYMGFGVWALVAQQITSQTVTLVLYWTFSTWYPKLEFCWKSFHEMWSFGWKLLVSSLLDTTWKEVYQVVIGKCYSPATLGLYTRAVQFRNLCSSNVTSIVQRVSYPVLSTIQDESERLKSGYQRIVKTTMFITIVLLMGMSACAKSMILVLIGTKWMDCVPMLQILCISGIFYPMHAINLNILAVKGRTDYSLKLEIIKKIIAVCPLLLGVFVGIYWMLIGSVVTSFTSLYLNAYYSGPLLDYPFREQIKDILPSIGLSLIMAIPVYSMSYIPISHFILFPLQIIVGATMVLAIGEKFHWEEYLEVKNIVLPSLNRIIKRK